MNNSNNFYEQKTFPAIEQVELAEDLNFTVPVDIEGKFYMKIMTPSVSTDEIYERKENGLERANYIILKIPSYILFSFMTPYAKFAPNSLGGGNVLVYSTDKFTIPKGTKFLVEFVGGILRLEHLAIVGIYYEDEDE